MHQIPHGTILLLDDDPDIVRSLRTFLTRSGYGVLVAHRPSEAIHLARSHPGPIHLLVTDLVMPEMSGTEVAERIREIRPEIRVIVMSGYLEQDALESGEAVLGGGFLVKPFELEELRSRVEEQLRAGGG